MVSLFRFEPPPVLLLSGNGMLNGFAGVCPRVLRVAMQMMRRQVAKQNPGTREQAGLGFPFPRVFCLLLSGIRHAWSVVPCSFLPLYLLLSLAKAEPTIGRIGTIGTIERRKKRGPTGGEVEVSGRLLRQNFEAIRTRSRGPRPAFTTRPKTLIVSIVLGLEFHHT